MPFAGALVARLTDFGDLFLMDWLGGISDYRRFDKICDLAFMATFAIGAVRWKVIDRELQAAIAPSEGPAIPVIGAGRPAPLRPQGEGSDPSPANWRSGSLSLTVRVFTYICRPRNPSFH